MATWTVEEANEFLRFTGEDRLAPAWRMSLYGLRRGEVLGLRWTDIEVKVDGRWRPFTALHKTDQPEEAQLTVNLARTIVEGDRGSRSVVESTPKTERSNRTLPIDTELITALRGLRTRQAKDKLAAGEAGCPDCGGAHVFVDELGAPIHPESYSDRFEVLVRKAGLPPIRLHDTRHTCGTVMHLQGVPTAVISAWLGHASASFTMNTFVHSQDNALREAASTLTQLRDRDNCIETDTKAVVR